MTGVMRCPGAWTLWACIAGLACRHDPPAPAASPSAAVQPEPARVEPQVDRPVVDPPAVDDPPIAPPPVDPPAPQLVPDGSLVPADLGMPRHRAAEDVCASEEAKVQTFVESLRGPCSVPEDCQLLTSACPFGCYEIISKQADLEAARKVLAGYFRRCPVCKHKCRTFPSALACVDRTCRDPRDVHDPVQ